MRRTVVTSELVVTAATLVRLAHPANASLHRAVTKASPLLITQPWRIDEGTLRITSASKGNETHRTDGTYCECECTRGVCWHVGAWFILSALAATGLDVVADLPLPFAVEDDELPGDFLDWFGDDGATEHEVVLTPPAFEEVDEMPKPIRRVRETEVIQLPPRGQRIITIEPVPGSDFARAQAAVDELFAA